MSTPCQTDIAYQEAQGFRRAKNGHFLESIYGMFTVHFDGEKWYGNVVVPQNCWTMHCIENCHSPQELYDRLKDALLPQRRKKKA